MKILHIHPSMQGGGIESMICSLSNAMVDYADVSVCSIFEPKIGDVFWNKLSPKVKKKSLGKVRQGFSVSYIFKIYLLCKNGKYDVINIHGYLYYYIVAVLLLHRKIKFFYTVHTDAFKENVRWDKLLYFLKKFCFKRRWINPITISAISQQSFYDKYHCYSKLIYNGVNKPIFGDCDLLHKYRINENTKLFIHAGRIDVPKNQLVLCQVFKELLNREYDIVLLIAGSKQREDIYDSLVPFFSDRIHYIGEVDNVPQLMSQCDAMCLPSIWEGMPVTLLEALSVGCIPICSPVGGITNVIKHDNNGILSLSSDYYDYLGAMVYFLSLSEKDRKDMRQRCLDSFPRFEISNIARQYFEYYNTSILR